MEVNTNIRTGGVNGITPQKRTAPASQPASSSSDSFASSTALDSAVKNLPASRPEAVVRAQALAADPNYPPSSTIRQISSLLARSLSAQSE